MSHWFQSSFSLIEEGFLILEKAAVQKLNNAFFVDFYISPSFSNTYRLLLVWELGSVFCQKLSLVGEDKILIQEGRLFGEKGSILLDMLQKLQVPFHPYRSGQARDGNIYKLCIGQDSSCLSLQWWDANLPPGWEAVEEIADFLENLTPAIEWEKDYTLVYSLETEGHQSLLKEEKQLYLSFKKE